MKNQLRNFLWKLLGVDYQQTLKIHDYVFLKNDPYTTRGHRTYDNGALVWRWTKAKLTIGKYCSIANNVRFIVDDGYHTASPVTAFPLINNFFKEEKTLPSGKDKLQFLESLKQREGISIGNDVWIGMGAYIMPGVRIGNGATIGANSVVTKDVMDYQVVGGNPVKVIKHKYDETVIQQLNAIAWWDWDDDVIRDRVEDFYLSKEEGIERFIEKYG